MSVYVCCPGIPTYICYFVVLRPMSCAILHRYVPFLLKKLGHFIVHGISRQFEYRKQNTLGLICVRRSCVEKKEYYNQGIVYNQAREERKGNKNEGGGIAMLQKQQKDKQNSALNVYSEQEYRVANSVMQRYHGFSQSNSL